MARRSPSPLFPYTTLFRSDYQGGVGRDEITQHTEARGGGSYLSHMAQDRSGGLPRYHDDYDAGERWLDRKSTRLNSSHLVNSYAVFCLKKKNKQNDRIGGN